MRTSPCLNIFMKWPPLLRDYFFLLKLIEVLHSPQQYTWTENKILILCSQLQDCFLLPFSQSANHRNDQLFKRVAALNQVLEFYWKSIFEVDQMKLNLSRNSFWPNQHYITSFPCPAKVITWCRLDSKLLL